MPMRDWLSDAWYDFNYTGIWIGYHLAWSYRSLGFHHVPRRGPYLIVANHQSYLDPLLVGLAVRKRLTYLARKTLFSHRFFGAFLRSVRCVPVDQEGVAKEGLKAVLDKLKEGHPVLVFPEGERSADGRLQPFRPGVQLLIKRGGCPVLPVGLAGAFQAYPRHARFPHFSPLFMPATGAGVAAVVGRPIDSKKLADLPREKLLDVLFREVDTLRQRAEALRRKP
jgi:1-acyl-sn-glycerol-3-phosphate acyltransferase